jgi:hypothetical protein
MRRRGAGKVANVRNRSRTTAIEVCLPFNIVVVFAISGSAKKSKINRRCRQE